MDGSKPGTESGGSVAQPRRRNRAPKSTSRRPRPLISRLLCRVESRRLENQPEEEGPPSLPPFLAAKKRDEDDDVPSPKARRKIGSASHAEEAARRSSEHADSRTEAEKIIDEYEGWRKVRKGLGWLQFAFFLSLFPSVGQFVVAAYCRNTDGRLPDNFAVSAIPLRVNQIIEKDKHEGLLGRHDLTLWKEAEIVYTYGIPLLAFLCALIGLLKCAKVPELARTRGVAGGTLFLTFIAFVAFVAWTGWLLLPVFGQQQLLNPLPPETQYISWTVLVFFGPTAIGWLGVFLGQAGFALNSTRALRDVALSMLATVVLIAGVLIGNQFYPLLLSSPKMNWDEVVNTYMIQSGVYMLISMVVALRMMSIMGIIRRAVKRFREANQGVLDAV